MPLASLRKDTNRARPPPLTSPSPLLKLALRRQRPLLGGRRGPGASLGTHSPQHPDGSCVPAHACSRPHPAQQTALRSSFLKMLSAAQRVGWGRGCSQAAWALIPALMLSSPFSPPSSVTLSIKWGS